MPSIRWQPWRINSRFSSSSEHWIFCVFLVTKNYLIDIWWITNFLPSAHCWWPIIQGNGRTIRWWKKLRTRGKAINDCTLASSSSPCLGRAIKQETTHESRDARTHERICDGSTILRKTIRQSRHDRALLVLSLKQLLQNVTDYALACNGAPNKYSPLPLPLHLGIQGQVQLYTMIIFYYFLYVIIAECSTWTAVDLRQNY